MKEQIHTIPVNEGFDANDECPFCYMERQAEQSAIRYTAGPGASYMEPETRAATDKVGFCREHMKKLYDYGNALGNALMLQTHMAQILEEFHYEAENFQMPEKKSLFSTKKVQQEEEPYWKRLEKRVNSCFICDKVSYNMARYYHTFFVLIKDKEFRKKVEDSKGFCLRHFVQLMELAQDQLPNSQREWFYATIPVLMEENLIRVKEDLDGLVAKYDYRGSDRPWGNSRDALQRSMQKLEGGHPEDRPYRDE